MEKKVNVSTKRGVLMFIVAILIIFLGIKVVEAPTAIILLFGGVIMTSIAVVFGVDYNIIQNEMIDTIKSMLVAILILISVGVLVGTWMISGTVPSMIYYGMKTITPRFFLPIVCLVCTLMSTMAGTSWGTLATVGVAFMGVAQGLGVPANVTAGAIVVGAFFGDKISPLSDSPVLVSSVTDVHLIEGIKNSLVTSGLGWIVSMVFFTIYGAKFAGGTISGEHYNQILEVISSNFTISPFLFLPPIVVVALVLLEKPTLPTFTAGILVGALLAIFIQGENIYGISQAMLNGFTGETGIELVDNMIQRGGMSSMLGTVGLLLAAGVFGAPLKAAGIVNIMLDFVHKLAKSEKSMTTGVFFLHSLFFMITGAYYVSYPVIGPMVVELFPDYNLKKENLMRILIDTGTGLAPLVPWSTTGAYAATTLGVANMEFAKFAPMLWLSILFTFFMGLTGIGLKHLDN